MGSGDRKFKLSTLLSPVNRHLQCGRSRVAKICGSSSVAQRDPRAARFGVEQVYILCRIVLRQVGEIRQVLGITDATDAMASVASVTPRFYGFHQLCCSDSPKNLL